MRNRNDFERLRFERHVLAVLVYRYVPAAATLYKMLFSAKYHVQKHSWRAVRRQRSESQSPEAAC